MTRVGSALIAAVCLVAAAVVLALTVAFLVVPMIALRSLRAFIFAALALAIPVYLVGLRVPIGWAGWPILAIATCVGFARGAETTRAFVRGPS